MPGRSVSSAINVSGLDRKSSEMQRPPPTDLDSMFWVAIGIIVVAVGAMLIWGGR